VPRLRSRCDGLRPAVRRCAMRAGGPPVRQGVQPPEGLLRCESVVHEMLLEHPGLRRPLDECQVGCTAQGSRRRWLRCCRQEHCFGGDREGGHRDQPGDEAVAMGFAYNAVSMSFIGSSSSSWQVRSCCSSGSPAPEGDGERKESIFY